MLYASNLGPVYQDPIQQDEGNAVRASQPNMGENARSASPDRAVRSGTPAGSQSQTLYAPHK